MMIFWVSAPCTLVGRCQRFAERRCLHLKGRDHQDGVGERLTRAIEETQSWRHRISTICTILKRLQCTVLRNESVVISIVQYNFCC